jgi:hypothetical protein
MVILLDINNKQKQTLHDVYENPVRSNIDWDDIESLLRAAGAQITEGNGSRVRVILNGVKAVFHRPHPQRKQTKAPSNRFEDS